MAIISANRLGSINGRVAIAANESYGVEDMGRILIENEMNDMQIFNAVLKSDMYEMKCRTEGTLLESELQSLSENAVQDLFKAIIAKLKKFWAKMKGLFQKAYAMITAYCMRNGKGFIAANKKALSNLSDGATVKGEVYVATGAFEKTIDFGKAASIVDTFKGSTSEGDSRTDMTKAMLKSMPYMSGFDGEKSVSEHMEDTLVTKKKDPTLSECGGKASLMADLENGTKAVKKLKETERALEKQVKDLIKKCESEARNAAKDAEGEAKDAAAKKAEYYRIGSTAVTNAMSTYTRSMIRMVKFRLAQDRIILAKAIAGSVKMESTLLESMILEAMEDAAEMGEDTANDLTPEEEEIVDAVIDAVDEKLSDECDGCDDDDDGSDIEASECNK